MDITDPFDRRFPVDQSLICDYDWTEVTMQVCCKSHKVFHLGTSKCPFDTADKHSEWIKSAKPKPASSKYRFQL